MDVIAIAKDTLAAIEQGYYLNPAGERVALSNVVNDSVKQTRYINPEAGGELLASAMKRPPTWSTTEIEFKSESTLMAAQELAESARFNRVGVLNFAAALSPGGRFLAGARAQEETLARSSALYPSLVRCPEYYRFHHEQNDPFYSDRMIYSPACPVFKDDGGTCLDLPYTVDILTSAAPYAGFVTPGDVTRHTQLRGIFYGRGAKVLALFESMGCDSLILGAWGCGAFCNDPEVVAGMFCEYLGVGGRFWGRFKRVRFSILPDDHGHRNIEVFRRVFEGC